MVGVVSTVVYCVGRVPFVAEIMIITSQVWGDLGVMTRGHLKASEEHVIVVAVCRVKHGCAVVLALSTVFSTRRGANVRCSRRE